MDILLARLKVGRLILCRVSITSGTFSAICQHNSVLVVRRMAAKMSRRAHEGIVQFFYLLSFTVLVHGGKGAEGGLSTNTL